MGTTRNQYVKLERGSEKGGRRLSDVWIERAAKAFEVDPGDIVSGSPSTIPVIGYVGAGSVIYLYGDSQGEFDRIDAPDGSGPETVAAEIRGDSLGPFFDSWCVVYDDVHRPVTDSLDKTLCIVGLADGRVMVKKIQKSKSQKGLFNLLSQFDPPIYDVEIDWAAKIRLMVAK